MILDGIATTDSLDRERAELSGHPQDKQIVDAMVSLERHDASA
jgi:hypothetical protein